VQLRSALEKTKSQIVSDQEEIKLLVETALTKMKTGASGLIRNKMVEAKTDVTKFYEILEESRLEALKMNEQLASKLAKSQNTVKDAKNKLQISELKNKAQR